MSGKFGQVVMKVRFVRRDLLLFNISLYKQVRKVKICKKIYSLFWLIENKTNQSSHKQIRKVSFERKCLLMFNKINQCEQNKSMKENIFTKCYRRIPES